MSETSIRMIVRDREGRPVKVVGGTLAERGEALRVPVLGWIPAEQWTRLTPPIPFTRSCRSLVLEITR